jgi:hypothetical protein
MLRQQQQQQRIMSLCVSLMVWTFKLFNLTFNPSPIKEICNFLVMFSFPLPFAVVFKFQLQKKVNYIFNQMKTALVNGFNCNFCNISSESIL